MSLIHSRLQVRVLSALPNYTKENKMFGLLKSFTKLAVNTVTLPVNATKDILTGDIIEDRNATTKNFDRIRNNVKKIEKELDD